jgi:hypothetical protein
VTAVNRKLNVLTFTLGGIQFQKQLTSVIVGNNTDDPTITYTFAPDGQFAEEADDSYDLQIAGVADWTAGGLSDYLWSHKGESITCQIDQLVGYAGEQVRWTGTVYVKAPAALGEVRTTERFETTMSWVGAPVYSRP